MIRSSTTNTQGTGASLAFFSTTKSLVNSLPGGRNTYSFKSGKFLFSVIPSKTKPHSSLPTVSIVVEVMAF